MKSFAFCRNGECRVWFDESLFCKYFPETMREWALPATPHTLRKSVRIAAEMWMLEAGSGLLEAEFYPNPNGDHLQIQAYGLLISQELSDGILRGIIAADAATTLGAGLLRFDSVGWEEMGSSLLIFESLARFVTSLLPVSESEAGKEDLEGRLHVALSSYFIHPFRSGPPEPPKQLAAGERVRVTGGDWIGNPVGVVVGLSRQRMMRIGWDYVYYVEFDKHMQDIEGEGPYYAATVISRNLERIDP